MLCLVVSSKLQAEIGRGVKERVESLLGMKTLLLTEFEEVKVEDGVIIVPATGGTEKIIANVIESTEKPVMIWALPNHNSLPSALEVYSVYRDRVKLVYSPIGSEILDHVSRFIGICNFLNSKQRLGVVGGISEWLLSSDYEDAYDLGVEVVEIGMDELIGKDIYEALKDIVRKYRLSAVTVRCFDLLEFGKTACLAMAKLNEEIPAGCEGDIGAILTMMILRAITGKPCWMANVCRIDGIVLAHCTVPLSMVESYEMTIHAESGKGKAVRGKMRREVVTLARYGKKRMLIALGEITRNLSEKGLCRTQVEVRPFFDVDEFVENSLGNHIVLAYGDYRRDLKDFCKFKKIDVIDLSPYRPHHGSGAD